MQTIYIFFHILYECYYIVNLELFYYFIQGSLVSTVKSCHIVGKQNVGIEKCGVQLVFLPECRLEPNSVVFCHISTTIMVLKQVHKNTSASRETCDFKISRTSGVRDVRNSNDHEGVPKLIYVFTEARPLNSILTMACITHHTYYESYTWMPTDSFLTTPQRHGLLNDLHPLFPNLVFFFVIMEAITLV